VLICGTRSKQLKTLIKDRIPDIEPFEAGLPKSCHILIDSLHRHPQSYPDDERVATNLVADAIDTVLIGNKLRYVCDAKIEADWRILFHLQEKGLKALVS
jgi:hypothetical protein